MKRYYVSNIDWDTDGEDVNLPTADTVICEDEDGICDILSDRYKFCVKTFCAERVKVSVNIGMVWQMFGTQCLDLPDDIDENDPDAVKAYILSKCDEIPIPEGEYIANSDELDEEYIEICYEDPDRGDES